LSCRYVACDPDNVVDVHKHNGHANYRLAWALSETQAISSRPTARNNNRRVGLSFCDLRFAKGRMSIVF
jgi:hypothetical protein